MCSKEGSLVRVGQAGGLSPADGQNHWRACVELGTLRPASEKLLVAVQRVDQGKGPEGRDTEPLGGSCIHG